MVTIMKPAKKMPMKPESAKIDDLKNRQNSNGATLMLPINVAPSSNPQKLTGKIYKRKGK
jgi:hypothetical protein